RLGQLEGPVAEVVPRELVERGGGIVEAVLAEGALDGCEHAAEARPDPPVGDRELHGLAGRSWLLAEGQRDETRRVPELVAEVSVAADAREVEANVAIRGGEGGEGEAQRVRAVRGNACGVLPAGGPLDRRRELRLHEPGSALGDERLQRDAIDDVERIDHVAARLRHLVAVLIA